MPLPEWFRSWMEQLGRAEGLSSGQVFQSTASIPAAKAIARDIALEISKEIASEKQLSPAEINALGNIIESKVRDGYTRKDIIDSLDRATLDRAETEAKKGIGVVEQVKRNVANTAAATAKTTPAPNSPEAKHAEMLGLGFAFSNGQYIHPGSGIVVDANGNFSRLASTAAAAAGRDSAAIGNDNAQAAVYRAQADKYARLELIVGQPVPGSPGFFYDENGVPKDLNPYEIERARALLTQNTRANDLALKAETNADFVARGRLGVEGRNADNTNTYQMGLLGQGNQRLTLDSAKNAADALFQQGQLSQGAQRLGLDTATARADAESKAQQNNLARQAYVGKVLSSPSDFIARAFMQRGESSPSAPITQADLINQVNTDYYKSPLSFGAPVSTPGAPETMQPNLPQQPPTMAYGSPPAYAHGTPAAAPQQVDPVQNRLQKRTEGVRKLLQHVQNPQTLHQLVDELTEQEGRLSAPAYAQGGMVRDKVAIVGDPQTTGVPNPEVIHNPTGAPISVTPMNRLQQGDIPMYASGTPYSLGEGAPRYPTHPPVAPDMGASATGGYSFGDEYARSRGTRPFNSFVEEAWVPESRPTPAGRNYTRIFGEEEVDPLTGRLGPKFFDVYSPEFYDEQNSRLSLEGGVPYDASPKNFSPKPRPGEPNIKIRTPNQLKDAQKSIDTYISLLNAESLNKKTLPSWVVNAATISTEEGGKAEYDPFVARRIIQDHVDRAQERIYQADITMSVKRDPKIRSGNILSYNSEIEQALARLQNGPTVSRSGDTRLSAMDPQNKPGPWPPPVKFPSTPTNDRVSIDEAGFRNRISAAVKNGDMAGARGLIDAYNRLASMPLVRGINRLAPALGLTGIIQGARDVNQALYPPPPEPGNETGSPWGMNMYANGTGLQADASGNFTFNGRSITNADINGTSTAPISSTTPSTVTSPTYPVGNPTGVSPASVSMNRLQGQVYDFYDKETGEAGYNNPNQVAQSAVPMPTMSGNRGGQSNSSLTPTSSAYDYRIPDVQLIQPRLAPPRATQAELVSRAESTLPPALRQLFGGINPAMNTVNNATNNPQNPTGINPLRFGFNLFSPEALSNLTEAEKQALNSYLGVKYNTSLEDVMTGMRQSYTSPRVRTGRLARAK